MSEITSAGEALVTGLSTAPVKAPVAAEAAAASEQPKTAFEPTKDKESARFAALMKKERAILQKQQELKSLESRFIEEQKAHKSAAEDFEKAKVLAKQSPIAALEQFGWSYDDATNFVLNDKKPPAELAVKVVKDELAAFKREQEEEKQKQLKEAKELAAREEKELIEKFHSDCIDFIKHNEAQYELVNIYDAGNLVVDIIKQHYVDTKRLLSFKEAGELAEKYLEEQAERVVNSKKWKSRTQAPPAEPKTQPSAPSRTLNNSLTSSTPGAVVQRVETDSMKRALAALESRQDPMTRRA